MQAERGSVRNRNYYNQVRDFSGLKCGANNTITPTDMDLFIEYQNICYICGEFKYQGAKLEGGQRLAFERLCDDLEKVKPTIMIVASHNCQPSEDIDTANTQVEELRMKGEWRGPKVPMTTKELIDNFITWVESKKK